MNKPSWENSPSWAQYMAMDEDGEWYWYELEPIIKFSEWKPAEGDYEIARPYEDWKQSLEKRP